MITTYALKDGHLVSEEIAKPAEFTDRSAIWIDLVAPTADEIATIEKAFAVELPTPDEMKEIEISSRLYQEGRAQIMTSSIVYRIDTTDPQTGEVAFVVLPEALITVRFAVPRAFQLYSTRAQSGDIACTTPTAITIGLIEAIIERQADLIERLQHRTEVISHQIFDVKRHDYTREKRHAVSLKEIGKVSVTASRVRDSLVSLSRLLTYFRNFTMEQKSEATLRQRIKTAQQDVQSLGTYVDHISARLTFLMDATIGLIGIEQNQIIKLFSVAAVMLMPPTLIASVYGMNFKHMPELDYTWSYPVVIGAMVVSAIVPFIYFKYKGWF
ncbi:MAG: magnesium transporter CorA family protein [Filomicrobium sp.]